MQKFGEFLDNAKYKKCGKTKSEMHATYKTSLSLFEASLNKSNQEFLSEKDQDEFLSENDQEEVLSEIHQELNSDTDAFLILLNVCTIRTPEPFHQPSASFYLYLYYFDSS